MLKIYKKICFLFDQIEKKRALSLLFLMTLMSLFEVIGIGFILPFLTVLGDPEVINTNIYLNSIYRYFDFKDTNSFLIFLGLCAFIILLCSGILKSITLYVQFRFSNMRRHSIGLKFFDRYLHQPYSFFLSRNSSDISKTTLSEVAMSIGHALIPALNLVESIISTIVIGVFLVLVDPYIAFILMSLYFTVRKYLNNIGEKRMRENVKRFKNISEVLDGIKDLKILGYEFTYKLSTVENCDKIIKLENGKII